MLGLVPDSKTLFFSSGVPCGRVPFISHVPQVCACCSRSRDTVTAPAIGLCLVAGLGGWFGVNYPHCSKHAGFPS